MRGLVGIVVILFCIVVLAQQSLAPKPAITTAPEPSARYSADCQYAFFHAASVPAMHDTVTDLDPAVRACHTLAEWEAASADYPKALDGADPELFARNRCAESYLEGEALCRSLR